MWHTLLLYRWKRIFAWLPIETLIRERQAEYYEAIQESTRRTDCAVFVEFMLRVIHDSLEEARASEGGGPVSDPPAPETAD